MTKNGQSNKTFTEYEISKVITNWLKKNYQKCSFCAEFNFDINDVKVDGYKVYDFDRLVKMHNNSDTEIFMLYFTKKNNKKTLDVGGNDFNSDEFLRLCKNEGRSKIFALPENEFVNHDDGLIFICFTGNATYAKIEKFRYIGFSQMEIIGYMASAYKNLLF